MMNMLNSESPRDHPIGLYIENKEVDFYLDNYGIDVVQMTYDTLAKYNIETVEKATAAGLPIIMQSFETNALEKMATLTDLPLVQLMHWGTTWSYDFEYLSELCHGVGPDSKYVMYWPNMLSKELDPTTRSAFIDQMHELELAVHPWTMRDDHLVYMDSAVEETMLYITKGIDGLFTEFPHTTL